MQQEKNKEAMLLLAEMALAQPLMPNFTYPINPQPPSPYYYDNPLKIIC